jgi:hypothetical protein
VIEVAGERTRREKGEEGREWKEGKVNLPI